MKKYYSNQNSNRIKGKIGDFTHFKSKLRDLCKDLNGYEKEKKKIQFSLNDSIRKSGSMVEETTSTFSNKQIISISKSPKAMIMNPIDINIRITRSILSLCRVPHTEENICT